MGANPDIKDIKGNLPSDILKRNIKDNNTEPMKLKDK